MFGRGGKSRTHIVGFEDRRTAIVLRPYFLFYLYTIIIRYNAALINRFFQLIKNFLTRQLVRFPHFMANSNYICLICTTLGVVFDVKNYRFDRRKTPSIT